MTDLIITEPARELGIINPVGCIISPVEVRNDASELDDAVRDLEAQIQENASEILGTPESEAFRDLFSRMGYPDQTPAGERLVNIVKDSGLNRHNNIVDAYNIASAEYGAGLGMHDAGKVDGDVIIRRASGSERIQPMFKDDYRQPKQGDLIYSVHDQLLALLGHIDVDSERFKVTASTDQVLLLALGNHETSEEYNREICERAFELISLTNPDATIEFLEVVHSEEN